MYPNVTAIIMAGGLSRRMGSDKRALKVGPRTLLEHVLDQIRPHFEQVLVSANDLEGRPPSGVEIVRDEIPGRGPLMGLVSAMERSANPLHFVQACDIPETDHSLIAEMIGAAKDWDAVVPRIPAGHVEPLFAIYNSSAMRAMKHVLEHENGKTSRVVVHCRTRFIELASNNHLGNLNTQADYLAFIEKLG